MKSHSIEFPWDIDLINAEIFIRSVLKANCIELPVSVTAISPSWVHNFLLKQEKSPRQIAKVIN